MPTDAITRELYSWWLGLRQVFSRNDVVEIAALHARFDRPDLNAKRSALDRVTRWVHEDYTRKHLLKESFGRYRVSLRELNERYFMTEAELRRFSRHPLVTIGGHTTGHPALAVLDPGSASGEIADNRAYLQTLLDAPVDHFAYPYGSPKACGPREAELVASAGYRTAVTMADGPVPRVDPNPFLLPRVAAPIAIEPAAFDGRVSGVNRSGADLARRLSLL